MAFRPFSNLLAALAVTLMPALPAHAQTGDEARAIIVLDASNSMWGQIDGVAKIVIAREALAEVLAGIDPDLALGLMAYGHRRRGDCADIELLVPPVPGTAGMISRIADGLTPRGKTPLTDAVRAAAEAVSYTEDRATVILITDGIETCEADPCALGRELERLGVDFTAHVVGFGLSVEEGRQVACLAEETGGLYLPAGDAAALDEALTATVAQATAEPTPVPTPRPTATPFPTPAPTAGPTRVPTPTPLPLPDAALRPPPWVAIATPLTVGWDGPGTRYDAVELWDPRADGGSGARIRGVRLIHGDMEARTVTMPAPATPGLYELRYIWGEARTAIATATVEVVPALVLLSAPEAVEATTLFTVGWEGPGDRNDYVELWTPGEEGRDGQRLHRARLANGDMGAQTVTVTAPAEPGPYELRYFDSDDRAFLAARPVEVVAAVVALAAPEAVEATTVFTVHWTGPGGRDDFVELWDLSGGGEGVRVTQMRLANGDMAAQTVPLTAPAEPGIYELRYWDRDNDAVLATRPVEVVPVVAALEAPATVEAGWPMTVGWTGPGGRNDYLEVWDAAGTARLQNRRLVNADYEARQVHLTAPSEPGRYELRYYNRDNDVVLARRTLEVLPTEVALTAPDHVPPGERLTVGWTGPGTGENFVELWDLAADRRLAQARVTYGDMAARTVSIAVPDAPGAYELRYFDRAYGTVMARRPLTVAE